MDVHLPVVVHKIILMLLPFFLCAVCIRASMYEVFLVVDVVVVAVVGVCYRADTKRSSTIRRPLSPFFASRFFTQKTQIIIYSRSDRFYELSLLTPFSVSLL